MVLHLCSNVSVLEVPSWLNSTETSKPGQSSLEFLSLIGQLQEFRHAPNVETNVIIEFIRHSHRQKRHKDHGAILFVESCHFIDYEESDRLIAVIGPSQHSSFLKPSSSMKSA